MAIFTFDQAVKKAGIKPEEVTSLGVVPPVIEKPRIGILLEEIQKAGQQFATSFEKAETPLGKAAVIGTLPLRAAGVGARAIGQTIAEPLAPLAQKVFSALSPDAKEDLRRFGQALGEKLQQGKEKIDPEMYQSLSDIVEIAGFYTGGKGAQAGFEALKPTIETGIQTGKEIVERGFKTGLEKGKEIVETIKEVPSKVREKVTGIPTGERDFQARVQLVTPKATMKGIEEGAPVGYSKGIIPKGKVEGIRDPRIVEIANATEGILKEGDTAISGVNKVEKAIEDTSEIVIKPFLSRNPVPLYYDNFIKKLELVSPSKSFKRDSTAFQTYNETRELLINKVGNALRDMSRRQGDFKNLTDFNDVWDSRKMIDSIEEAQLKVLDFGTPEYTGIKSAVQDFRKAHTDFILDSLAYPGQMEQLLKVEDFFKLYKARGGSISSPEQAIELVKQFGISNTSDDIARSAFFRDKMKELNLLYEAKANLRTNVPREIGKTKFQVQHPTATKVIKRGAQAVGIGAAGGLGLEVIAGD